MSDHSFIAPRSSTTAAAAAKDAMPVQEQLQAELEIQPFKKNSIQFKLAIGTPDDSLKYEADTIADTIMRMPEQNFIQRKCSHCKEEEKIQHKPLASFIQRKESSAVASETVSGKINSSNGCGSSMDSNTQTFMQSRFGTDFSDVKIHTGDDAIQMNRELSAKAFTAGNDIYFNEGQYNPGSGEGKHLLAHELVHTMQQGHSVQKQIMRDSIKDDFITYETAAPHDLLGGTPDFSMGNYSVNDLLLKAPVYQQIRADLKKALANVYGPTGGIPEVEVRQTDNPAAINAKDANGICINCNENCNESMGVNPVSKFLIDALLFTTKNTSVFPRGFKIDLENTLVATASTMFHELLHLWFYQYKCAYRKSGTSLPSAMASGHDDASKNQFDPDFVAMWQQAVVEIENNFAANPFVPKVTDAATPTKTVGDIDASFEPLKPKPSGSFFGASAFFGGSYDVDENVGGPAGIAGVDIILKRFANLGIGGRGIYLSSGNILAGPTLSKRFTNTSPWFFDTEAGVLFEISRSDVEPIVDRMAEYGSIGVGRKIGSHAFWHVGGYMIVTDKPDIDDDKVIGGVKGGFGFEF